MVSLPYVSRQTIESVAGWEGSDVAEVPNGGPQKMQEKFLADLRRLVAERPDLADLIV